MVKETSLVKQLSLNHLFKIGLSPSTTLDSMLLILGLLSTAEHWRKFYAAME
jgi:hypothetical protein